MDWTQALTIIGVNVGVLTLFATLFLWAMNRIDSDIQSMNKKLDSQATRLDGHATRIDQLYKMFVDLLQDRK